MKRILLLALMMLLLLSTQILAVLASAQTEKQYVAEVIPAPIGYSFQFQNPYPKYIAGYRDKGGNYHPYRAELDTGTLILADDLDYVDKLISGVETGKVKKIIDEDIYRAYGIDLPGLDDLIIYGGGKVYISQYNIYINNKPESENAPGPVLVINEYMVDFRESEKYSLGLAISSLSSPVTVITRDGLEITTRLSDLLDVSEACVSWFQYPPPGTPWVGGIVMSPTCLKNIKVIKTFNYEGRPYAVVFSARTKYGKIQYVIMAAPTAEVLEEAGIISPVRVNEKLHIIKDITLDNTFIYIAPSEKARIEPGTVVHASDATQIITENGEKKYVCVIPSNTTITYYLLWRNRELKGTVYLEPGEIVLMKIGKKYYYCHGDLSWLDNDDMPIIKASGYKEIKEPILMYTLSGKPFLVFTANGKVYSSNRVKIPFDLYEGNEVFIFAVGDVRPVVITQSSIFASPFFILSVLFVGVVISLVVFSRRKEEPEKIKIILDLPKPTSMKVASKEIVSDVVRKHVDQFGVCPDVLDVVIYHNILPPLPDKIDNPFQEILLCPFKTNEKTERVLRKLAEILLYSVWALRRSGRSRGFFYTLIGDTMLYMYWYKHEDEKKPEELILNAIESAYRTSVRYPYYKQSLGLVILVEDELLTRVKKEVEYMRMLSSGEESVRGYAISSYLSVKGLQSRIPADRLQKFMNEKIPAILVVSESNLTELIEYLEERLVSFAELYYKKVRGEA